NTPKEANRGLPPQARRHPPAREDRNRRSGFDRIAPLPILGLGGYNFQPQLLRDGTGEKAAHGMRLPAGSFHEFLYGGPVNLPQHIQDLACLGPLASSVG